MCSSVGGCVCFVCFICLGPPKKHKRCPAVGPQPVCFLHSPGFIVPRALSARQEDVVCFLIFLPASLSLSHLHTHIQTDTHTDRHTYVHRQTDTYVHTHTLFMWERMGPLWIKLFPCITLDKAFNISNLLCPNSDLAQAEWRAGKSQSCCRVFGVTHSFIITIP